MTSAYFLVYTHITMVMLDQVTCLLTGRQNSSKAGLTNCVYCVNTCSSSRPRSCISLNTVTMTTVVTMCRRVCHLVWQAVCHYQCPQTISSATSLSLHYYTIQEFLQTVPRLQDTVYDGLVTYSNNW